MEKLPEDISKLLVKCKYEFPAYCTTYDKQGNVTSRRVVTHSLRASKELTKLHPDLAKFINPYNDDDALKVRSGTVKQMLTGLGK